MGVYLLHAHVSKQAARFAPRNHANCDDLCTNAFRIVSLMWGMIASPCSRSFADSRGRIDSWMNFDSWNKEGGGRGGVVEWQRDASRDRYRIFSPLFRAWDGRSIIGELIGEWIYLENRGNSICQWVGEKLNNFLTWIQVNM